MVTSSVSFAAAALAASALAIAVPVTAQAAGTTGPCGGAGTGNPVQHTGNGHHSFTGSHSNCVNFVGVGNTAELTDSDFNLLNFGGVNDTVHDFSHSSGNTITFQAGTAFDTLTASNAANDTFTFLTGSQGDSIELVGLTNDSINISGSNDFLVFTAGCGSITRTVIGDSIGSALGPITIC